MITQAQVKEAILSAGIDVNASELKADDDLGEHGLDSLDFFNLYLELEDLTGKKVPDEEMEKLQTISAIIKFYE